MHSYFKILFDGFQKRKLVDSKRTPKDQMIQGVNLTDTFMHTDTQNRTKNNNKNDK